MQNLRVSNVHHCVLRAHTDPGAVGTGEAADEFPCARRS